MKDRNSNFGDPTASEIWVDRMADLIDKMGGKVEFKTLFFGERVEESKKNTGKVYTLTTIW